MLGGFCWQTTETKERGNPRGIQSIGRTHRKSVSCPISRMLCIGAPPNLSPLCAKCLANDHEPATLPQRRRDKQPRSRPHKDEPAGKRNTPLRGTGSIHPV